MDNITPVDKPVPVTALGLPVEIPATALSLPVDNTTAALGPYLHLYDIWLKGTKQGKPEEDTSWGIF